MSQLKFEGSWQMISQRAGDRRGLRSSENGVPCPGKMDLIKGIEFYERADQSSSTFAEQGFDLVILNK